MTALSEEICKDYLLKLEKYGEEDLYQRIVKEVFLRLDDNETSPEYLILNCSDAFFQFYRRTGEEKYFIIGKVLRRAGHVVYRELLRKNKIKPDFKRFLNKIK